MFRTVLVIACFVGVQGLYGGNPANIWDFSYQAAILRRHWDTSGFYLSCNGAIISDEYILTTASCAGDTIGNIKVRVGSSYHDIGGIVHGVKDIYKHFNFTPDFDYDIALLKLSDKLKLSHLVSVVKLPAQNEEPRELIEYELSGWGYSRPEESEKNVHILRNRKVFITDFDACKNMYNMKYPQGKTLVTDNMVCVNFDLYRNGNPGCQQDQGAPLIINGTVHGLFSWNYKCGQTNYPSVFTKVSRFRMWIDYILELY